MKIFYLLTCLALLSFNACTKETNKTEPDLPIESEHEFFDPQANFSISDISTPHDYPSSLDEASICEGWKLRATDISPIIKGARVIEGSGWHHIFDHLPCNHRAVLLQGKKEYELSLNGGSWMSISNSDSIILLGSFNKKFDRFFLSEPMRAEDY